MEDEMYGGTDDLTAAIGYEEDGVTTFGFRRKLRSNDKADHGIEKGQLMEVLWAVGQPQGIYSVRRNKQNV